ncbi:MAG: ABC transporter substrate-binding protein [Candidatus Thorarchaeota archaeon]
MERRKAIGLAVSILVVSSVVAFVVLTPSTTSVRIGYLSQDLHQLALKVAQSKGWFEEKGLSIELLQYQNGAYEMNGFGGGQIQMGYLGAAPAMVKGINEGIAITILAAANLEGSAISVMKSAYDEGDITEVADLQGRKVYHPGPSTVQNFLLRLALNSSGLTIDDINPEVKRVQDMAISLSESTPAFIAWEPFPAQSDFENTTIPLILSGDIWPNHPCCVVAAKNEFMASNPDVVQKVVSVHKRAEEWIVQHPSEALQIAIEWMGIDEGAVELAFNRIIYDYRLNRTGLRMYLDFLIHQDLVEMDDPEQFLDGFINTTFIENA